MKRYDVTLIEDAYAHVYVDANSEEEAENIAMGMYDDGIVNFDDHEARVEDIEEQETVA